MTSVFSLPVPFMTGYPMDRFGRKPVIGPAYLLTAAAVGFLAFTAHGPLPFTAFIAAYLLAQLAQSGTSGSMQVLGADLAPAAARGRFFAIRRSIAEVASALSPSAIAILALQVSHSAAFGRMGLPALAGSVLVVARVVETHRPNRSPSGVPGAAR